MTKYSKKMVNSKFYSTIEVNPLTEEQIKNGEQGYIFMPYITCEHTEESLKEYNTFMDGYHKKHECCPKCGSKEHWTTLMGYPLVSGKEDEYKDLNSCTCLKCGNIHSAHDRISQEDVDIISFKK